MPRSSLSVLSEAHGNRDRFSAWWIVLAAGLAWLAVLGAYVVVRDVIGWI